MKHTILSIIFLIVLNFFSSSTFSQTNIPGGTVSGAWTKANSPYLIQGPIMVEDGQTLSIEPGVRVEFQGVYKFLILGRLLAIGTKTDTIVFTATNITSGWKGIRFDFTPSTNDTTKIIYCKIQHGKTIEMDQNGGGLYFINFSKAVISNSSILNCTVGDGAGGGIYCGDSNPVIMNNRIMNNTARTRGGGIYCNGSSIISNNIISNNAVVGGGGGIGVDGASVISNNIITYNTANSGGGIFSTNSPTILNNIISNNTSENRGGGVSFEGGNEVITNSIISNNKASSGAGVFCINNVTISNSIISNNTASSFGGGIHCYMGDATIINSTITYNSSEKGGGLYCSSGSNPTLRNSILWGNTSNISGAQVFLVDEGSDPKFNYCDVQGGKAAFETNGNFYLGTYQNNIDADPLFIAPSSGSGTGFNGAIADWSLQTGSPCINKGDPNGTYPATDLKGNPRVSSSIIDIGAYEYQGTLTGIVNNTTEHDITIYPNPNSGSFTIEIKNSTAGIASVSVINILGETIFKQQEIVSEAFGFPVNLGMIAEGIYIVKVQTTNRTITKRMIIR